MKTVMERSNRVLQAIGIAIIIITFIVIGVSFATATSFSNKKVTLANMLPRSDLATENNVALTNTAAAAKIETSGPPGTTHTIQIVLGSGEPKTVTQPFLPGSIVIRTGDSIKWINQDNVGHTVTSTYFNSGMIWPKNSAEGSSTFTHKFDKSGTYSYFCQIHPYMSGTVYVDVQETQRQLVSTNHIGESNILIEIPQNAAYQNNYGPYFIPANAIVPSGSRVTWVNHDFIAHTATSSDGETFDAGNILPSQSSTMMVNGTGRLAYFCEIHPWMQASLTIVDR